MNNEAKAPVWAEWTHEQWCRDAVSGAKIIGPTGDGCHVDLNGLWMAYGNTPENAWKSFRKHHIVQAHEQKLRSEWEQSQPSQGPRTVPIGGDPKDFCECGHHEMNHANYEGMNRACNQTHCKSRKYQPEAVVGEANPVCDTTMTPRNPAESCVCEVRTDLMGPCDDYEVGGNGRCVYCDHECVCHQKPCSPWEIQALGSPREAIDAAMKNKS